MHIESDRKVIARKAGDVFSFISDFRNFGHLMPPQVLNYQASYDECSFDISSMGHVSLEMKERLENVRVMAVSGGKTAIKFEIILNLAHGPADSCTTYAELNAELSPMIAMLARNPLNNFINMLVDKLKEVMETA